MQNNFIFVDTESSSIKINDVETLKFKLGCSILWNRDIDKIERFTFYNVSDFWDKLENFYSQERKQIILFAHNSQFDFKMLNGFAELINRDWKLEGFYVRNMTFILVFKKFNKKLNTHQILHIWDTTNFVRKELKEIGKSINLPKLDIDFDNSNDKELEIYCMRDTEIIYQFIRKLIMFLESNNLSKLKATAGSLSFNTFRHSFYSDKKENTRIYIHDWKKSIQLERKSYKGGISDCFKIGKYNDLYKMDINSMYPYIMRNCQLPYKLVFYSHESKHTQKDLKKIYEIAKNNNYGVIMNVLVKVNKDNAYILHKFKDKSLFAYGIFRTCLCSPELDFIEQHGKILKIYEINVYKMRNIFRDFVDFFYNLRIEYKKNNDLVHSEFCKLMLNTQYGKWGQRDIVYKELTIKDDFLIKNKILIEVMIKSKQHILKDNKICYLGTIVNDCELYVINGKLYQLKQTYENSKESFVAIPSFITSYARMLLIKYLKISKRDNVCYADTDSLFCNNEGYSNLLKNNCISDFELGKLKVEEVGNGIFYSPKFYDFNDTRKCKGVRKNSELLIENNKQATYIVELWQRLKADLKEGTLNEQKIITTTKTINKFYDKGKVNDLGNVIPYYTLEILI